MSLLVGIIVVFLLIRLIISLVNVLAQTRLPRQKCHMQALVSVLIPARNESRNIASLLQQLSRSTYPHLEILVYDDLSTDNTADIVLDYARYNKNIKLIRGTTLPNGWLGKNHACDQLARKAKGDYLLFLDADVTVKQDLLANALSYLNYHKLSLLSLFPVQIMQSPGEKITVPLMNWILASLLPLPLIHKSRRSSLAAANGQFMLFTANNYHHNLWHQRFKRQAVEDINIMRAVKRQQHKGHTLLSNGQIQCRMYTGFREAINGFSKNTHEFFGKSYILMTVFALISSFGFIPVYYYGGIPGLGFYFFAAILLRLFTSLASRQNALRNILLSPFQQFALLAITYKSMVNKFRGYGVWKGRKI
ncbi:MAG: glycosyltransferase [Bacteroidota bacterium]